MESQENNELNLLALPDLEPILEALIFMAKEPVTVEKMLEALQAADIDVSTRDINRALKSLLEKWQAVDRKLARGLLIKQLAGGYVMISAPEHGDVLKKMVLQKPLQLTKAQIEVLSIVAYRQPLTRVDIDEIRGVDSSFALKKLMQLKLLKILGKSEGLGRPLLYGTSKDFLEFFSLNSLSDLPTLKQYDSLSAGEEMLELDMKANLSVKDLFLEPGTAMFSEETERMSSEAWQSLDEALLQIESAEKHIDKQ